MGSLVVLLRRCRHFLLAIFSLRFEKKDVSTEKTSLWMDNHNTSNPHATKIKALRFLLVVVLVTSSLMMMMTMMLACLPLVSDDDGHDSSRAISGCYHLKERTGR